MWENCLVLLHWLNGLLIFISSALQKLSRADQLHRGCYRQFENQSFKYEWNDDPNVTQKNVTFWFFSNHILPWKKQKILCYSIAYLGNLSNYQELKNTVFTYSRSSMGLCLAFFSQTMRLKKSLSKIKSKEHYLIINWPLLSFPRKSTAKIVWF